MSYFGFNIRIPPVKAEDIPKTAFIPKYGLYEFKTMPFGLCKSPLTFQRFIELARSCLQWWTCVVYLDGIIVFSSTFDERINRVGEVINRLQQVTGKLEPEKCSLLQPNVRGLYIGFYLG